MIGIFLDGTLAGSTILLERIVNIETSSCIYKPYHAYLMNKEVVAYSSESRERIEKIDFHRMLNEHFSIPELADIVLGKHSPYWTLEDNESWLTPIC